MAFGSVLAAVSSSPVDLSVEGGEASCAGAADTAVCDADTAASLALSDWARASTKFKPELAVAFFTAVAWLAVPLGVVCVVALAPDFVLVARPEAPCPVEPRDEAPLDALPADLPSDEPP
jgi:hypothetical protein